ncbi:MAG: DUF3616 domain-containing protein [Roseibium sp.]|uniref:DUF3616 domain-containing protein n=1 Tax=Roseibium sp. TaxID=1936156 RepID=UPI002612EC3B|nr:DUF3616 domain-containing protein [Roseibium sp.]MCV0427437.1 DUF3616 domain-containing protein [Roseibium sp.]
MRPIILAFLVALSGAPASAEIVRSPEIWRVKPDFEKSDKARESISGAACAPAPGHCLAVNDEKKYAQFFTLSDRHITPGQVIRLLPGKIDGEKTKEIDAEGVVFIPPDESGRSASFFITGSHGLSRSGEFQQSRYVLFRVPVDAQTGLPTFEFDDKKPAPEISMTTLLRQTIKDNPDLAPLADKKLDRNGVTIEGLSIQGRELLFGLRSPCVSGQALILHVPIDQLFKTEAPTSRTTKLELGDNVGIRDLTAVRDGFLILSGRSDDRRGDQKLTCGEKRTPPSPSPSIWFWSGKQGDAAEPLGTLPGVDVNASAETLLVLEDTSDIFRVLVLFDGEKNGAPVEFTIEK